MMALAEDPDLAHDGLGELHPSDWSVPRPVRTPKGRSRNAVGRTGPRPDPLMVVRFVEPDPRPRTGPDGRPMRAKARPATESEYVEPREVPTLRLSQEARLRVERGKVTARVTHDRPAWQVGDVVPVLRFEHTVTFKGTNKADRVERDDEIAVEILSVEWMEARAVTSAIAAQAGYSRLGEFARSWLQGGSNPPADGTPLDRLVARLAADTRAAWVTTWVANHDQKPRWLAPQNGTGYVETAAVGLSDAGVCVPRAYQQEISEKAWAEIRRMGRHQAAERRKKRRAADPTRQHQARRKATLPRAQATPATDEQQTPSPGDQGAQAA